MDRVTAMPHEIELELKKFELKISKLNKEEMFKELMLLKFDSENNFYFIKKYLRSCSDRFWIFIRKNA